MLESCQSADPTGKNKDGAPLATEIAKELKMPTIGATGTLVPATGQDPTGPNGKKDVFQLFGPDGSGIGKRDTLPNVLNAAEDFVAKLKKVKP